MVRSARSARNPMRPAGRRTGAPILRRASKIHVGGTNGMRLRLCWLSLFLIPSLLFGVNKDIAELQRDLSQLTDEVRAMRSSSDQKFAAMGVIVQQILDASNSTKSALAVLDSRINDRLEKQSVSVGQPVAVISAK